MDQQSIVMYLSLKGLSAVEVHNDLSTQVEEPDQEPLDDEAAATEQEAQERIGRNGKRTRKRDRDGRQAAAFGRGDFPAGNYRRLVFAPDLI
jgi:hypothetical protein